MFALDGSIVTEQTVAADNDVRAQVVAPSVVLKRPPNVAANTVDVLVRLTAAPVTDNCGRPDEEPVHVAPPSVER